MFSIGQYMLGLLAAPSALAVPPPNFGFPEAPNDTLLAVAFPQQNGSYTRVDPGILFGPQVANATYPTIALNLTAYESLRSYNGSYLAIMVDPDASYPENPTSRFILHYLQANLSLETNFPPRFPDSNLQTALPAVTQLFNNSPPYASYNPPRPPTNSSAHRYILYAFQQPADFAIPEIFTGIAQNRQRFNLTAFISAANLGTPAAANYFYASSQSGVPERFLGPPGSSYPGGNGAAVTSGDPASTPTSSAGGGGGGGSSSSSSGGGGGSPTPSSSSTGGAAAKVTAASGLLGAGLLGLAALL